MESIAIPIANEASRATSGQQTSTSGTIEPRESRTVMFCANYLRPDFIHTKLFDLKSKTIKKTACPEAMFDSLKSAPLNHFGGALTWVMVTFHHKPSIEGSGLPENNHIHLTARFAGNCRRGPKSNVQSFLPVLEKALLGLCEGVVCDKRSIKVACKLFGPKHRLNESGEAYEDTFKTGADYHIDYVNNPDHTNHTVPGHKIIQLGEWGLRPAHGGDTVHKNALHLIAKFLQGFKAQAPPPLFKVLGYLACEHPNALLLKTVRQLKQYYTTAFSS